MYKNRSGLGSALSDERQELLTKIGKDYAWSYLTALYYTFITTTTIGFGDVYVYKYVNTEILIIPIVALTLSTTLIAVFAHVFTKLQTAIEETDCRIQSQLLREGIPEPRTA